MGGHAVCTYDQPHRLVRRATSPKPRDPRMGRDLPMATRGGAWVALWLVPRARFRGPLVPKLSEWLAEKQEGTDHRACESRFIIIMGSIDKSCLPPTDPGPSCKEGPGSLQSGPHGPPRG